MHNSLIDAGSDLVLTNSLGGDSFWLKLHDAHDRVAELNEVAAVLARQVADAHTNSTGRQVVVAGSIGPTGELFEPLGELTHSIAREAFREQASALAKGGVDVLWIETMSSEEEFVAAIEAAKTTGLPICNTMTFDIARWTMMGETSADFARFCENLILGQGRVLRTIYQLCHH